jgi:hypothetical protein
MKTAVEWLIENSHIIPKNELNKRELINQAKEMEKEQQNKMYSEEEVLELLNNLRLDSYNHGMGRVEFLEWFEQFKKK